MLNCKPLKNRASVNECDVMKGLCLLVICSKQRNRGKCSVSAMEHALCSGMVEQGASVLFPNRTRVNSRAPNTFQA